MENELDTPRRRPKGMRRMVVVTLVLGLLSTACTSGTTPTPTSTSARTIPEAPSISPATQPRQTTTTSVPLVTDPTTSQPDPNYYTFSTTTRCDPEARNADLQLVQAFFTAYNERNLARLTELIETEEIWDPSGAPHTGQVLLTNVAEWAESGWEVDDRFELVRLVSYGPHAGSGVTLIRRNEVLESIGVDDLVVGFKIPSSGCMINRLVGHVDPTVPTNCGFYDVFLSILQEELTQDWSVPAICTVTTPPSVSGPD